MHCRACSQALAKWSHFPTCLFDGCIDQQSGKESIDPQKGVTWHQSSAHLRRIDADRNGAGVGTREHEAVDHLTNTQGFSLVGWLNELSCILSQKKPGLVLHREINDVAMILNTLNTSTKQLGKKREFFCIHTHHITATFSFVPSFSKYYVSVKTKLFD